MPDLYGYLPSRRSEACGVYSNWLTSGSTNVWSRHITSWVWKPTFADILTVARMLLFFCELARVWDGDDDVVYSWQSARQCHFLGRLRPLQWTLSNRGSQRRRRYGIDVCSCQQPGRVVRRWTAGKTSLSRVSCCESAVRTYKLKCCRNLQKFAEVCKNFYVLLQLAKTCQTCSASAKYFARKLVGHHANYFSFWMHDVTWDITTTRHNVIGWNAASLQTFCKLLQVFATLYFILHVWTP